MSKITNMALGRKFWYEGGKVSRVVPPHAPIARKWIKVVYRDTWQSHEMMELVSIGQHINPKKAYRRYMKWQKRITK